MFDEGALVRSYGKVSMHFEMCSPKILIPILVSNSTSIYVASVSASIEAIQILYLTKTWKSQQEKLEWKLVGSIFIASIVSCIYENVS